MGELTKLGYELKLKLLQEGKTQSWLAKQYGISRQLLSNCLYGESNLKLRLAIEKYVKEGVIEYDKNQY